MSSHVHVEYDFTKPVERIFPYLAAHETAQVLFAPVKFHRLNDGDSERDGVGSRRKVVIPGLPPLEETITEVVPNERIVYRITKGGPLNDHEGVITLSPRPDGGCHVDYRIRLGSKIPGVAAIVKAALTRSLTKGMPKVDAAA